MIRVMIKLWQFMKSSKFDFIMASVDTVLEYMIKFPEHWKELRNTPLVTRDIEKIYGVYIDFIEYKDLIYCIKYNPLKFESLMKSILIKVNIVLESIFVAGSVLVYENRWYSVICTLVIMGILAWLFAIFMYARNAAPFIIIIFKTVEQIKVYDTPSK